MVMGKKDEKAAKAAGGKTKAEEIPAKIAESPPATRATVPAHVPSLALSDSTLEDIPRRALSFLLGISRSTVARTILAESGYDGAAHAEGWRLLQVVGGHDPTVAPPALSKEVSEAVKALDAWDEKGFRLIELTWQRRWPDLLAFVLRGGLHPETGEAAVRSSATILQRLDEIPTSEERKDFRARDAEALALLARRGLNEAERRRLSQLVEVAKAYKEAQPSTAAVSSAERKAALENLYLWWEEWSEVARLRLTRRDHLILLGLAKRKVKKKEKAPPPPPKEPGQG
jgi:hypothetical protein